MGICNSLFYTDASLSEATISMIRDATTRDAIRAVCGITSESLVKNNLRPLPNRVNVNRTKHTFGVFEDEVYFGYAWGAPVILFAGSDIDFKGDASVGAILEWIGNVSQFVSSGVAPRTFYDEVYASLPVTHKTGYTVLVGKDRGGFTMSDYVTFVPESEVGVCVFVGAPGELCDCRNKAKVLQLKHVFDPVSLAAIVKPIHSNYTLRFGSDEPINGIAYHVCEDITNDGYPRDAGVCAGAATRSKRAALRRWCAAPAPGESIALPVPNDNTDRVEK